MRNPTHLHSESRWLVQNDDVCVPIQHMLPQPISVLGRNMDLPLLFFFFFFFRPGGCSRRCQGEVGGEVEDGSRGHRIRICHLAREPAGGCVRKGSAWAADGWMDG